RAHRYRGHGRGPVGPPARVRSQPGLRPADRQEARGPTQVPARGPAVSTRGPSGSVPLVTTPIAARETDHSTRRRPETSVLSPLPSPRLPPLSVPAVLVVGLALIPEAIAFSITSGVDPQVGLFSPFIMAASIAFLGGRPAMISAATGAVALVIAPVAREHGMDMFIATVMLAGVFQILLAVAGVAKLIRFIPRSVMVGFVNALSILVFAAQVPHVIGVP